MKPLLACIGVFCATVAASQQAGQPFGTTIVTHGLQQGGKSPWVQEMAEAVLDRALLERGLDGTLLRYDPDTGSAKYVSGLRLPQGEVVFIFNWAEESDLLTNNDGSGEAAGDALFAALANTRIVDSDGVTPLVGWEEFSFVSAGKGLHFIGHSRGAVVNSEAVERLVDVFDRNIEQITTLDPHPWGLANDPDPETWQNVVWADNYYQNLLFPTGQPIDGAWDVDLSLTLLLFGCGLPHSAVHDWYHGTIDLSYQPCRGRSNWYGPNDQDDGYWFSDIVGGGPRDTSDSFRSVPTASAAIYNGDFELGGGHWAGWRYHGGFVDESAIVSDNSNFVLKLGSQYAGSAQHNRLYLRSSHRTLELTCSVLDADETQTDQLVIELVDLAGQAYELGRVDLGSTTDWQSRQFDICVPADKTYAIQFRGASTRSQIALDDITLLSTGKQTCPVCAGGGIVIEGTSEVNDFNATCGSDDQYWSAHGETFAFALTDPVVQFELTATASPGFGGNAISVDIEASKPAENADLIVRALLFNFASGSYVAMPGTLVLGTTDTIQNFTLPVGSDPADFVEPGTDKVTLLIQTTQTSGSPTARTQLDEVLYYFD